MWSLAGTDLIMGYMVLVAFLKMSNSSTKNQSKTQQLLEKSCEANPKYESLEEGIQ